MSFNTIYSYLKKIENSLSAPEVPEIKFLNVDLYKNKNFNLKTFASSIFENISDTSFLLNQLKTTIDKTKNDIVNQINSNFNNYVALISKLQAIDFLIDNINTSLSNIKSKINSELGLISKYEKEFKEMLEFIKENDKDIKNVNELLEKYNNKIKCEKLIETIDQYIKNNLPLIKEGNYTVIRKYLFYLIDFYKYQVKGVEINNLENELEENLISTNPQNPNNNNPNVIEISSKNYYKILEGIYQNALNNYFNSNIKNTNWKIQNKLNSNILGLINKILSMNNNQNKLYEFIYDNYTKVEFNKVFEMSGSISLIINEITKIMNSDKYIVLQNEFNNINFLQICFLLPFINKFTNDKFLFNCSDFNQFKDNYISILEFIKLFNLQGILNKIKNFLSMFSFFTYFQYMQNDISIKLMDLIEINENNQLITNDKNITIKIKNAISSFMVNIQNILNEKKLFLKNIPNFLQFVIQCSLFLNNKIKYYEKYSESYKLYSNKGGDGKQINFDMDKEVSGAIYEYLNNKNEMIKYFKNENDFHNCLIDAIERESFIFGDDVKNEIIGDVDKLCSYLCNIFNQ